MLPAGYTRSRRAEATRSSVLVDVADLGLPLLDEAVPLLNSMLDFKDMRDFAPNDYHLADVDQMLDQVAAWSTVLAPLRASRSAQTA